MFKKRLNTEQKVEKIIDYDESGNGFLSFKHYSLHSETITQSTEDEEGMLIVLKGRAHVEINGKQFLLERENVFSDKPEAVYIPINSQFKISTEGDYEAALVTSYCDKKQNAYFISKDDIDVNMSGKEEWERKVRMIEKPTGKSFKLIIGEGINLPGRWSGMPPHKHDTDTEDESILKEIYYFKINPATSGYGLMTLYDGKEIDEVYKLKSDDLVFIPRGYHSIVSTPGTELYFLWILAGPTKRYKVSIDEEFSSID